MCDSTGLLQRRIIKMIPSVDVLIRTHQSIIYPSREGQRSTVWIYIFWINLLPFPSSATSSYLPSSPMSPHPPPLLLHLLCFFLLECIFNLYSALSPSLFSFSCFPLKCNRTRQFTVVTEKELPSLVETIWEKLANNNAW